MNCFKSWFCRCLNNERIIVFSCTMKLQTLVEIPVLPQKINIKDKLIFAGSCFADNMGEQFSMYKFNALVNPFGVLYNPMSVKSMFDLALGNDKMGEGDYVESEDLLHSFLHHSSFSDVSRQSLDDKIFEQSSNLLQFIKEADVLFLTWGTAWVFRYLKTRRVVSNCHKVPAKNFERFRLQTKQIVQAYDELFDNLKLINPKLQIVLTVSPVRHLKDTAHGNQLSKSVLLLAAEKLYKRYENVHYFPSYELVLDELRDYRFYAEDLTHPNTLAVTYIWEKLRQHWLDKETVGMLSTIKQLTMAANHRPFNPETEAHQKFVKKTIQKIEDLLKKHAYLNFNNELSALNAQMI